MGAPFWSEEEKQYFINYILPRSHYARGYFEPKGRTFDDLAVVMQRDMDERGWSRRRYNGDLLFQHWYQKVRPATHLPAPSSAPRPTLPPRLHNTHHSTGMAEPPFPPSSSPSSGFNSQPWWPAREVARGHVGLGLTLPPLRGRHRAEHAESSLPRIEALDQGDAYHSYGASPRPRLAPEPHHSYGASPSSRIAPEPHHSNTPETTSHLGPGPIAELPIGHPSISPPLWSFNNITPVSKKRGRNDDTDTGEEEPDTASSKRSKGGGSPSGAPQHLNEGRGGYSESDRASGKASSREPSTAASLPNFPGNRPDIGQTSSGPSYLMDQPHNESDIPAEEFHYPDTNNEPRPRSSTAARSPLPGPPGPYRQPSQEAYFIQAPSASASVGQTQMTGISPRAQPLAPARRPASADSAPRLGEVTLPGPTLMTYCPSCQRPF